MRSVGAAKRYKQYSGEGDWGNVQMDKLIYMDGTQADHAAPSTQLLWDLNALFLLFSNVRFQIVTLHWLHVFDFFPCIFKLA